MALKLTTLLIFLISATDFIDAAVPSGYTYITSTHAYYKLHKYTATWSDAVSTCRSEGARLFHPDSADELQLVWWMLDVGDNDGNWMFTGFSDLYRLKEYKTVDGRPISLVYDKWAKGEPDSGEENQLRCGRVDVSSNLLIVTECDYPRRFICKHEEEVTVADMKAVTAAVDLLKQEMASIKLQVAAANEEIKREIEIIHAEIQPSVLLENIAVTFTKPVRAIKQHQNQAAASDCQHAAANLTAAVEPQALPAEKLAAPLENSGQPGDLTNNTLNIETSTLHV